MNTEFEEHVSSLMDGEVNQETSRFLVRRLVTDAALRDTWARYHLVRDCLRYQQGHLAHQNLAQRVRLALAQEAVPDRVKHTPRAWFRPLAGAAIAASVAVFAVLTVSDGNQPASRPAAPAMALEQAVKPFASPNISAFVPDSQPVNLSGQIRPDNQKMNAYLLRHYQVTGEAGKGFVSFVPIVVTTGEAQSHDADSAEEGVRTRQEP